MYFQVEVEIIYKLSVKSISKNNLKIAEDQIVQGIVLATTTCHTLWLGHESTLLLGLVVT